MSGNERKSRHIYITCDKKRKKNNSNNYQNIRNISHNDLIKLLTDFVSDYFLYCFFAEDDQILYPSKDPPLLFACSLSPCPSTASPVKMTMKICL